MMPTFSKTESVSASVRSTRTEIGEGRRTSHLKVKAGTNRRVKNPSPLVKLYPCPTCHRSFGASSLQEHKTICSEWKKKREIMIARSPLIDRWKDTKLEPYIDALCYMPPPPRLYSYDWRSSRDQMYESVGITDYENDWDEEDKDSLKEDTKGASSDINDDYISQYSILKPMD